MDTMRMVDLMEWAKEKFGPETQLGKIARQKAGLLQTEADQLSAAREGWLVGLEEADQAKSDETEAKSRERELWSGTYGKVPDFNPFA